MKKAIIAGNGPSLLSIDYSRLPKNYDLFRTNQFYFEDKYYLGKKVNFAFSNPGVFIEQYYTLNNLIYNNEYQIDNILCATFNLDHMVEKQFIDKFNDYFPKATLAYKYLQQLQDFHVFIKFNEIYKDRRITSGVYMCAVAIALGYKELYLTGVDFYDNTLKEYAFKHKQKNIIKLAPAFNNTNSKYNKHSKEMDLEALEFLQNKYNAKLYTLNPKSVLSQYIDLAPYCDNAFLLENKPNNYTKDILIPKYCAYHYLKIAGLQKNHQNKLLNNIYYKLFKDLFRLPSDIKHYIKEKYANKNR
ncbi:alpha-2,3 sialyltransferase [Campylobacter jejuni]|uniref:alpha-2,3-sialyltransferase n=1 Tax=Campylobacter jejuni TaxID=197 RepID=UPI00142AC7BE|nr:alpha-2,3-sialyltransferase [Campylobacter jejuni]EAI4335337.1 alpha-2,3 sialyltransferase [Campylobacter jejuni]EAK0569138.1 alpha-2,3 sialyltransferase [Campylobacter jejuni]HDZ5258683.1 alpha-2,3 sialyltransferase [Campylobacter jejuni]